jgi:hypothetical protein
MAQVWLSLPARNVDDFVPALDQHRHHEAADMSASPNDDHARHVKFLSTLK